MTEHESEHKIGKCLHPGELGVGVWGLGIGGYDVYMAKIDPQNGFRLNRSAFEVVSLDDADPGVDLRWIESSTFEDRLRALELLRWQCFGKRLTESRIPRVFEVLERREG